MKKLIFYTQLFAAAGLLYACGGNQRENIQDTPIEQDMPLDDGIIPIDSLERDSLDTVEQMMPTPPLNE
ncbi:hypothetical protein FXV77_21285 [Sphingobacterium phlebotomi]|uniref:Uncharacterized protein n=1 Tax=Sphingobacterium phlebotomi TaxID=2605433 RepID=A0A5D4GQY6_9SPHI|nr:hypothetical protein [Sphingobacterium phlebotomi]TYR31231.1 hypothetical protein FXV77_21285 [Sphingobacterium phlebotomi]